MDDVFTEQPWRSLQYERVYPRTFETGSELRAGLANGIGSDNAWLSHASLAGRTRGKPHAAAATEKLAA